MNPDPGRSEPAAALIARQLAVASTGWSLGVVGALAEFIRAADEPFDTDYATWCATARGAIRILVQGAVRTVSWRRDGMENVALCLPASSCGLHHRSAVTEVGADRDAVRTCDLEATLFDLGLGSPYFDFFVRTADPAAIRCLRKAEGLPLFDSRTGLPREIPAMDPHRVFVSRLGRIEVYQPIPAPGARTPGGPHTHLLPALLATGRAHAEGIPIPPHWIPCANFHIGALPAHHAGAAPAH